MPLHYHLETKIEHVMDKISKHGPVGIFYVRGAFRVIRCDLEIFAKVLRLDEHKLVGVYDESCTRRDLMEDLSEAEATG